jgi:hypothetical protein
MFSPSARDLPPASLAAMKTPPFRRLAQALCLVLGLCCAGRGTLAQGRPAEVTSDTPEYCTQLAERIQAMERGAREPLPRDLLALSDEGRRLCDQGQTRNGITRLRRALLLLRHPAEPSLP